MGRTDRKLRVSFTCPTPRPTSASQTSPIQRKIGAPELVNRLLGIAHQEQLAGRRRHSQPGSFLRIAGRQQNQNLRLQGIGVLKLVDEDVRVAALQILAHLPFDRSKSRTRISRSLKSSLPARRFSSR